MSTDKVSDPPSLAPVLTDAEINAAYDSVSHLTTGFLGALRAVERAVLAKQAPRIAYEKREAERVAWDHRGIQLRDDRLDEKHHLGDPAACFLCAEARNRLYPALPNPDAPSEIPVWTRPSDGQQFRLNRGVWERCNPPTWWRCSYPVSATLTDAGSLAAYWTARETEEKR